MGVVSKQRDLTGEYSYSMVCDLAVDHTASSLPMAFCLCISLYAISQVRPGGKTTL